MKKSILLIFFLVFLQLSWAQLGGPSTEEENSPEETAEYTPIDLSEVESNPQLQGLLYIGVQNITQQAIQDGALPEGNYQVSQVNSAAQNTNDYRFEVEVSDGQDNTATIEFFISYDSSAGSSKVTSYNVLDGNEEDDDYTDLDDNIADTNAQIRGLLTLGVQNVTSQAIEDGALPDGNYQLARVNGVEQSRTDPNNYRFDVNLQERNSDEEIRVVFALHYDSENGGIEVLSYTVGDDEDETGEGETENEGELGEFGEGEYEGGEQTEDGFVVLDPSTADTDPLIRGILFLGVQEATRQAIANGSLYDSQYELANVHSIEQGIENPENYRFDVSVRNDLENVVRMNFDLLYDSSANSVEVLSFGYPNATIPGEEEEEVIPPVEEEILPPVEEEEVPPVVEEEENNGGSSGLPAGYEEIDVEQIEEGSVLYRIGDTGFKAAALRGYLDGTIPAGDYTSSSVNSVSKKVEDGVEYYRFDMGMTDNATTAAKIVYIVSYVPALDKIELFDYEISNVVSVS